MDEDFVARTARGKVTFFLIIDLFVLAVGLFLLTSPGWWVGIILILITVGFAVALANKLLHAGEELRANAAGLTVRRWAPRILPWSEIAAITVRYDEGVPHILLVLRNPDNWRSPGILGTANRAASWGDEFTIGTDMMDRPFKEVISAIARYYPGGVLDPMRPGS
jgi:hypothetical protein